MLSKRAKTGNFCNKFSAHHNVLPSGRKSRDASHLHPLQNKILQFTMEFADHSDNTSESQFASFHPNPHPSGNNPLYRCSPYRRSINTTVPVSVSVLITRPAACTTF